jgi:WD40-like Beta Propeller Repeat
MPACIGTREVFAVVLLLVAVAGASVYAATTPEGPRLAFLALRTVAFTGSHGQRSGIYAVGADGVGLHFLRGTRGAANPVFSPDGTKIAFARAGKEDSYFRRRLG